MCSKPCVTHRYQGYSPLIHSMEPKIAAQIAQGRVTLLAIYFNTCSFCIFIGRELCVIKVHTHGWRQLIAWSNLANLFRGSLHDFSQLYYNIKQIDFIFLCFCTVIDHRWRHSVWRTKSHDTRLRLVRPFFCSLHAMTSSVIYYSTDARQNEIYLLNSPQVPGATDKYTESLYPFPI